MTVTNYSSNSIIKKINENHWSKLHQLHFLKSAVSKTELVKYVKVRE